ncbi:MAG: rhodanese-like domain-containing protein [Deltaproteobacteria bacterium]|nr:rhodanese-like domain-containing protein [Deltaproteobacteria bacterium]
MPSLHPLRWSLCLLTFAVACSSGTPAPATASPDAAATLPDRDPALAHELIEQRGGVLLDVRTPEEYEAGHIEGAHNVPHDQVPAQLAEIERLTEGNRDTPIVVYCGSGRRAAIAKETLVKDGYSQVTNLGGKDDW